MTERFVRLDVVGAVATITLDSPATRNALSTPLLHELNAALAEAGEHPRVRAIVLTHSGPVFCAGADMKERLAGPVDAGPMVEAMQRLRDARQPTIASVGGPVRAGGVGLMAACDLVVVRSDVTFAFTEVRLGVAPAIISVPILQRVAASRLAGAFLTGKAFDAAHAESIGLVDHVADDIDQAVGDIVSSLLAAEPGAVAETKRLLRYVPTMNVAEAFTEMQALSEALFASPAGQEGMSAFFEKRAPSWAAEQ